MADPVDIRYGPQCDLLSEVVLEGILERLRNEDFDFFWLSPPCYGHSASQNGRIGGPLRDRAHPEGIDLKLPIIQLTNSLWEIALRTFTTCYDLGIHAVVEHPVTAFSWRQQNTLAVLALPGVELTRVDMCEYPDVGRPRTLKPTSLLSNGPWLPKVGLRCQKNHQHDTFMRTACQKRSSILLSICSRPF